MDALTAALIFVGLGVAVFGIYVVYVGEQDLSALANNLGKWASEPWYQKLGL